MLEVQWCPEGYSSVYLSIIGLRLLFEDRSGPHPKTWGHGDPEPQNCRPKPGVEGVRF